MKSEESSSLPGVLLALIDVTVVVVFETIDVEVDADDAAGVVVVI